MLCLRLNYDLMPVGKVEASKIYGLKEKSFQCADLPIVHTVEGEYGIDGIGPQRQECKKLIRLASRVLAKQLMRTMTPRQKLKQETYETKLVEKYRKTLMSPPFSDGGLHSWTSDHVFRFQATTQFPYYDPNNPQSPVQYGLSCLCCKFSYAETSSMITTFAKYRTWLAQIMVTYTEDELVEHVKKCPAAKEYVAGMLNNAA